MEQLYLIPNFIKNRGVIMKNAVIYIHGKGGKSVEAEHYKKFFSDEYKIIGFDYKSEFPWDAKIEFSKFFDSIVSEYDDIYFGETLSWEYLCFVRNNPIEWNVPTDILYAENDFLTSLETMTNFANKTNSSLTIMKNGEHYFHTEEQMNFLDNWFSEFI